MMIYIIYYKFGKFFYFRIIGEGFNLQASINVVGHFRGLKLGMQIAVSQRSKIVIQSTLVNSTMHYSILSLIST